MVKNVNKNDRKFGKSIIKNLLIFLVCLAVVASVVVPLPYYIEVPGSAENVRDFVSVEGKRNKNAGSFMLTTVGIRPASAASLLIAKFQPFQEVISKKDLMGDSSDEDYERLTAYQMTSSENMAKKVALDLAGEPYEFIYKGIYVMGVSEESHFFNELQMGDIVYEIDGNKFENKETFMAYVSGKKVGDNIVIKYLRDNKERQAKGKLIELPQEKKAGIGITLVDHSELKTVKDIKIKTEDIGGPSAGLMFTLELYDLLSGKDLRQGREIAGTGTIDSDGKVGSIGGIDKKIVAAEREGATVFFAPDEELDPELIKENPELKDVKTNYEEAVAAGKKIKTKMEIVPVKTVHDALNYLEKNK